MVILGYIAFAVALFFAGAWTFGVATRPEFRLRSTLAAIIYWWIFILASILGAFSPLHLWWMMPVVLLLMVGISGAKMRQFRPFSTSSLVGAGLLPALLFWFLARLGS